MDSQNGEGEEPDPGVGSSGPSLPSNPGGSDEPEEEDVVSTELQAFVGELRTVMSEQGEETEGDFSKRRIPCCKGKKVDPHIVQLADDAIAK